MNSVILQIYVIGGGVCEFWELLIIEYNFKRAQVGDLKTRFTKQYSDEARSNKTLMNGDVNTPVGHD